jgi:hypothetical protein
MLLLIDSMNWLELNFKSKLKRVKKIEVSYDSTNGQFTTTPATSVVK